ncbi:hypothetical protein BS78_07G056700 [Paspalum vaginatum]|nr:hypothetical protein BS78_07G056700 [Paspalum vaginatum]
MDVFEGAEFVRLRSPGHGTYLHAAEDGRGVLLDARGAAPHAAWAVQREVLSGGFRGRSGSPHLLLRGVYGRYLGSPSPDPSGPPLLPCRRRRRAAAQRDRDEQQLLAIMWRAVATGSDARDRVVLMHDAYGRYLRSNWRHLPCRAGVAVCDWDDCCFGRTMMWVVEIIPSKLGQPELPLQLDSAWVKLFDGVCPLLAGVRRWVRKASQQQREIRWVLADDSGSFREEDWDSFQHSGRSEIVLRDRLAHLTLQFCRLTLFIRAGRHGQLTPLVTDLPRGSERLDIVVRRADGIDDDQLIFPDVDRETAEVQIKQ